MFPSNAVAMPATMACLVACDDSAFIQLVTATTINASAGANSGEYTLT